MNAARLGWKNPWAWLALGLAGWAAAWLVTWGHFGFSAWEPQGSLADWQATRLWEEWRWDVPEKVTHVETFLVDGKAYMYFGPGPAFLRFLTYIFGPAEPGTWSRGLVCLGVLATLALVLSLIQWIARVRSEEGLPSALKPGWVGGFLLLLGFGSTLPFLASRAFVYHEAIVMGSAGALASYLALAVYLREPSKASLVAAGGFGIFAMLSRASSGGGTAVALGAVGLLLLTVPEAGRRGAAAAAWLGITKREGSRAEGMLALTMAALILASFGYVNHAKFGDATQGVPLQYHVSYQEDGRLEKVGGTLLHLRNVPRNLYSYLHPGHVLFDETFPWVYPTLASAIPLPAGEEEPPPNLGRPSRRVRVYAEPDWVAKSAFPNTYADFIERYASATAVMPGLLLLALIGFASLLREGGGAGPWLRLPMLGALAGAFPFLMSVGISHRFLHDTFPAAAIACVLGVFALADLPRGMPKKALVAVLLVAGLWGAWANSALAISYQRIFSWGTPFFFKTQFNRTQADVDEWVGQQLGIEIENTWRIGPAQEPRTQLRPTPSSIATRRALPAPVPAERDTTSAG